MKKMNTKRTNIGTGLFDLLTPVRHSQAADGLALSAVIERIRRRWRLRLLADGLVWVIVLATVLLVISAWLLNLWHFAPQAIWLLRLVVVFALLALMLQFFVKPLRREVDDSRVALYLEEREPGLNSLVLSAVDARRATNQSLSPQLVEQLTRRALDACAQVEYGDRVERQKLRHAGWKQAAVLAVVIGLAAWPPAFLRSGAPALLQAWTSASEASPYRIEIAPGDIEIARGDDQLISARIDGFDGDEVLLFTSLDEGKSWRQTAMTTVGESGNYQSFIFDLKQDSDYYVTGAGRRSPTHRISVADIPAIESIALRYHFPAYTMLPPETSQGSGDIAALRGTRVEVLIKPTIDIPGGALQLADGRRIELRRGEDENWAGEITIQQDGAYQVALQRASGIDVDASPEFRIRALDDHYPSVSITSPGRDTRVSIIEEPVLKVRASDDQGIANIELVLSVNGEAEQRVQLMPAADQAGDGQQVDAEHIVYLEDLGLRPGDLISYYVNAEDRAPADQARTATSDIFFYQVRPFRKNYRRAEQGGGGGGGGGQGGQQQGHLSEQQKQFVVATFKMIRDRNTYSEDSYRENLELLATAQARIRDRVEAIIRRISSRPIVQVDKAYKVILQELPLATAAMREVEQQLQETEVESALTDAQIALKHLQRADAEFRDINVSLANRGGGGAGGNTGVEDLANLFQLEMDKLRHQYETVQRGTQQQSPSEVIDETLDRLRELARRQQREVERAMHRQGQAQNGGSNQDQLALAEELEEMARQLERLSRTQPNPQLQRSISQMRNAAEAMRRAAASASAGGTGRVDQARQAAQNLREARRLLDQGRVRQFSEKVERSLRRAELAQKKQAAIKQEVSALDEKWGEKLEAQLKQLQQKKQALSEELSKLENELSELTTSAREEQPQAGQSLKRAIRASREHRLHDRIGRTRQMILLAEKQHALDNETEIQAGIGQIREHIETALENVGEPGARKLERSLEQLRDLARELRHLRQRAASNASGPRTDAESSGRPDFDGGPIAPDELEGLAERSRQLGSGLLDQGVPAGDIDPVLAKIQELSRAQAGEDLPASTLQHDLALRALMELEYSLRGKLEKPEIPELLISEPSELPEDYQQMVADYFRKLSQQ
jgi:hypothetical protein